MNQIIIDAIANKQLLDLRYSGYSRTVEPHAYGLDKNGVEKLRCFQVAGGSVSHDPIEWKILSVGEMSSVHATGRGFGNARPGYKRGDRAMQRIYAQL
jgi:hypothetical protein